MKFVKFVNELKKLVRDVPNLHWKTLKMVIEKFFDCLSTKEYDFLQQYDDFFDVLIITQLDIDKFLLKHSINLLGNDLELLKKDI